MMGKKKKTQTGSAAEGGSADGMTLSAEPAMTEERRRNLEAAAARAVGKKA